MLEFGLAEVGGPDTNPNPNPNLDEPPASRRRGEAWLRPSPLSHEEGLRPVVTWVMA